LRFGFGSMCGITGIIGLEDKKILKKMTDAISHRGLDDEGYFVDQGVSLGHRRLSIIDLSKGKQPIFNEDKSVVIVFNGEIYNYKELRHKLEGKHEFSTNTDTEVIVHLYEERGIDFVKELDGFFALAIFDLNKNIVVIARDHLGIKPLFYSFVDNKLIFASEMKAIFASGFVKPEFDSIGVREKFVFDDYTLDDQTLFKNIKSVPIGSTMVVDNSKEKISFVINDFLGKNYFEHETSIDFASSRVHEQLLESVKSRLVSDVPLGTLLSGGLDSSIVAVLHREIVGDAEDVHTFSVTDGVGSEDSRKAKVVAEQINSIHHEFTFSFDDVIESMPDYVYHLEDIEYGMIFNYFLTKQTKKYATVVLSGNGADEVFGGYDRYKEMAEFRKLRGSRVPVFESEKDRAYYFGEINRIKNLKNFLSFEQDRGQLSNFQMVWVDRISMAFGVEVRVPFLQRDLVNYVNSVQENLKINDDIEKFVLRKAARMTNLPKEIADRPKLPAGLGNTTPQALPAFDKFAKKVMKNKNFPFKKYIRKPGKQLAFSLLNEIYINGEKPDKISVSDFI